MPRLVVVSNRVSQPGERSARAGGLAIAMREALRQSGGLWFGWSGETASESASKPTITESGGITYATVDLGHEDHHDYYIGFANSTLWPLLHFRLGLMTYRREAFASYCAVNRHLAQTLAPLVRDGDLIWIHDYHLIPMAAELRALGLKNRIGFFLHTPLPPPEVMVALPDHAALMRALCAYDLVGFQTPEATHAFLNYVVDIAGGQLFGGGRFTACGMCSRAAAFPIGIDTEPFARLAERAIANPETRRLHESLVGRGLIIGVDRLDYSKGIPSRFDAIDSLLTQWPQHRGAFSYLQVAPHSRAEVAQYRALRRELEAAAGRVNGKFAEFDWTPIRYINKSLSRATLAGFYRIARIGLVTPLRDGMNLVAKEYVAAQDPEDPGVLVLSRFAGAARELDAALLVNPIDVDDIAGAIHRGLSMPLDERRQRWQAMMSVLRRNDISTWRSHFLDALRECPTEAAPRPGARYG